MQEIKSIQDLDVSGKRVLLRADFNVPIKDDHVVDDARIQAALPTIALLLERGAAKIIILTHLGRPKGKVDESLRVAPVLARLRELVGSSNIEILENLRFDPREESNDMVFATELAAKGDIYVNDAFANSHRAHASMVLLPTLLPSAAGLRLLDEITHLRAALVPPKGAVAVVGGAKFETKIPLFTKLVAVYDELLLGGALANDMLKARGCPVGGSLVSDHAVPAELAAEDRIKLPTDLLVGGIEQQAERSTLVNDIRINERAIDIGPVTALAWAKKIQEAPFVLWNGPMGVYEEGFIDGTLLLAKALVDGHAKAVVGGGDTAAALSGMQFDPSRIFVSTGGGAMLQFLAEGNLPAIEVLKK